MTVCSILYCIHMCDDPTPGHFSDTSGHPDSLPKSVPIYCMSLLPEQMLEMFVIHREAVIIHICGGKTEGY